MTIILQLKKCPRCNQDKPRSEFYSNKSSCDGLQVYCKECHRECARNWYANNIKRAKDNNRKRYTENPERSRQSARKWKAENQDRQRKYSRKYYITHRDRIKENVLRRRADNLQCSRENARIWKTKNPDRANVHTQRRRARKLGNSGSYTSAEWEVLCAKYDYRCLCCGERKTLTLDHIVPVSKGGENYISNIQPLCRACNSRKHVKTIDYRLDWT